MCEVRIAFNQRMEGTSFFKYKKVTGWQAPVIGYFGLHWMLVWLFVASEGS